MFSWFSAVSSTLWWLSHQGLKRGVRNLFIQDVGHHLDMHIWSYVYIYMISIQHIYIHTCSIWIHFFTRRIREKKLVSTLFLFATFISWVTFSRKTNLKWNEERHGWPRALRLLPVVAFGSPDGITGCRELPGGSDVFPWKWWENYDENNGKLRNSYFFKILPKSL